MNFFLAFCKPNSAVKWVVLFLVGQHYFKIYFHLCAKD